MTTLQRLSVPDFSQYNLATTDHRVEIERFVSAFGESMVPELVRFHMSAILAHYIECTWGACCSAKFSDLVQPYLMNSGVLDRTLRSEVIKNKGNIITGRTGARIFPELLQELKQCRSTTVLEYLERKFA